MTQFGSARVFLRLAMKVAPKLRRRLKLAFDREAVGSPFGLGQGDTPADPA